MPGKTVLPEASMLSPNAFAGQPNSRIRMCAATSGWCPCPASLPTDDMAAPGITDGKLGITDGKLVATILNNHLEEFHKWNHGYQTGKFKVRTSPSGHLLRSLGMA